MSFRPLCPKCQSTNVAIETTRTHFFQSSVPDQAEMHCYTCGKVIYGKERITQLLNKQENEWEARHGSAKARAETMKSKRNGLRIKILKAREKAAVVQPLNIPEDRDTTLIKVPSSEKTRSMSCSLASCYKVIWVTPDEHQHIRSTTKRIFCCPEHEREWKSTDITTCAWKDCKEPSSPKSKYCSRQCSNRNARYRHKLRKQAARRTSGR